MIFDDILQHDFKQKHIFDLANQPFSPINIIHEFMENTGIFDKYEMTTICMFDEEGSSEMFRNDELQFKKMVESVSDQILNFTAEDCKLTKRFLP